MAIYDLKANLDLKQNMNVYATCKQLDNLNLILSIYNNSVQVDLSSYTVRLKAMKADKVPLVQQGTGISISNNVVTIECDEQLTTTSGKTLIELQFIDNSTAKKKATFNLVLIVIASTLADGATISKSTYTLLEELENKMDQASNFFENIDEAITANNNLQDSIYTGNTLKTNLDNNITTGNTLNNDLETNISAGNILKPNLEGAVTSANTAKAELDISIQDANTFVSEHGDIIDLDNRVTQNTSQLNENTNILDKSYNLIEHTKNIIDFNLSSNFKLKSVFRKVLDQDGFLVNDMKFGYIDYFSSMNSSAGVFKRILNKGTSLLNTDLNKFVNADTTDVEEFFISNQTVPAPHFFSSLDIKSYAEPEGLTRNMWILYKDANNRVQVIFNQKLSQVEIYAKRDGTVTSTYYDCAISTDFKIGVYCANGTICVFIDRKDGYGWKHIGSRFCAVLSDINVIKQWKIGFGFNMSQMTTAESHFTEITNLEVRICAGYGYRDHTFIKYEDGSPLIKNGKMYLTVSMGGINIGSSGLGIIEYNPSDCTTKLVSLLYNKIGTGIYADGMAQVLFDRNINAWRVLFSGFASRSAGIYTYANQFVGTYKSNLLSGVHFVESSTMNLPENNLMNCYDGDAIFDKSINKWRLVYTAPFGTLHVVESSDFEAWSPVSTKVLGEGAKIVSLGGKYYITSSSQDKMYIMDYPNMSASSVINVDINPGHPNPHADIIAIPGNNTKYHFLTMDTRGCYDASFQYAWGNTYVYECDTTTTNYDFDYIEKI